MIEYTTGNLLKSDADALVNTVNCEGYMGKGIAYQFKSEYPLNNESYKEACKTKALTVGKLHYFYEKNKLIVNFPTKDKWRQKSKMAYISNGLDALVKLIEIENVKSIAIPPLGSGNGGLVWSEVRLLIEEKLSPLDDKVKVIVYEPSRDFKAKTSKEPTLDLSSLVLMQIKLYLDRFDKKRLQKTAFLMNIFLGEKYFKFDKGYSSPYGKSISILSKKIREYQMYHNISDTGEAYTVLYKKLISESITTRLKEIEPAIKNATSYVNKIENEHELECLTDVAYLLDTYNELTEEELLNHFNRRPNISEFSFSNNEVLNCLRKLYDDNLVEKTLTGYRIFNPKS